MNTLIMNDFCKPIIQDSIYNHQIIQVIYWKSEKNCIFTVGTSCLPDCISTVNYSISLIHKIISGHHDILIGSHMTFHWILKQICWYKNWILDEKFKMMILLFFNQVYTILNNWLWPSHTRNSPLRQFSGSKIGLLVFKIRSSGKGQDCGYPDLILRFLWFGQWKRIGI